MFSFRIISVLVILVHQLILFSCQFFKCLSFYIFYLSFASINEHRLDFVDDMIIHFHMGFVELYQDSDN